MMKAYTIVVVICSMFCFSCNTEDKQIKFKKDFVYIENSNFKINDKNFFPIIMNYVVKYRKINRDIFLGPAMEYDSISKFEGNSKDSIHNRIKAHFQLIKEMGFNSIRLVGLNSLVYDEGSEKAKLDYYDAHGKRAFFDVFVNSKELIYFIKEIIQIAKETNLRVMILLPKHKKQKTSNELRMSYIEFVLESLKECSTVFSYDFFNEPLYFDNSEYTHYEDVHRSKEDAYKIVLEWKNVMMNLAPNQLLTIGYAEPTEVFEWDPSLLPVDFVSVHTYNPLRVPNEIYWYSKYIDKPWIIGETSLPADNDSISYIEQSIYMKDVLSRVVNCGGSGFGWWQFQDVLWGPFEHNYTPLLNHNGVSKTKSGNYLIYGSLKPAVDVLREFDFSKKEKCSCHTNYNNLLGYHNFLIKGTVVDINKTPLEGAVIRGWNESWGIAANTFSDSLGNFTLYSNDEFVHFEVSSSNTNTLKFDHFSVYSPPYTKGTKLKNQHLEYHNIHYKNYLLNRDTTKSTFNFDPDLFNKHIYQTTMDTLTLRKLQFNS